MSVKLDVIARGATAAIDRNSPKARQDKWMLEVERAMLASTHPPAAAPSMPAPLAPAVPDDGAMPGTAARVVAHAGAREAVRAAPREVAGGSVHGTRAAYARDDEKDAPGAAQATLPSAAAAGTTITPAVPAAVPAAAPTTAAPSEPTPAGPGVSAPNPAAGPASAPGTVQVSPGSAGAVMAFEQAGGGTGTFFPSTASGLAPTAVEGARGVLAPVQAGLAATPGEAEHQSAPTPRRAATAAFVAAENEPYAPSNLHVIDVEGGIRAWVRDARMTPYQEQAVAQAMIAQFAQQGVLVGSVTVNGRVIGARADAERDEQSPGYSTSEPPATTAEPITTVKGAV